MKNEIERRLAQGCQKLTLPQLEYILAGIGYRLDRNMDCKCTAKNSNGTSYPCTTTGITHVEAGLSAFSVEAPRDINFDTLQKFRFSAPFVVLKTSLLEI